jgi:chitinase
MNDVSRHFTLAFILGRDCAPYWAAVWPLDSDVGNAWLTRINELKAAGGDVIISFGGAVGPYLEHVCSSASSLQAAYAAVVNKYHPYAIDLDVEEFTNVDLRNQALAGLQSQFPGLRVHYTLGVLPTGLTSSQISVLESARRYNVRVDLVNIMAMDYYQNVQDMGGAAIQAAQATRAQLDNLGFTSTRIGITPMIGVNDSREVFTLEDAQQLVTWARNNGIALLSFWSVGRDNGGCPNGTVSPSCSGIAQSRFQFSSIFRGFP